MLERPVGQAASCYDRGGVGQRCVSDSVAQTACATRRGKRIVRRGVIASRRTRHVRIALTRDLPEMRTTL